MVDGEDVFKGEVWIRNHVIEQVIKEENDIFHTQNEKNNVMKNHLKL